MNAAPLLVRALAEPARVGTLGEEQWTSLVAVARAESLIGSLAFRLEGQAVPAQVAATFEGARRDAEQARRQALWDAEMARRALAPLGVPVILLKGAAYAAAGLEAGVGRSIGDLDILVPRDRLPEVERALLGAGWEWVKEDAYDDLYYRRWMHELPPLIHRERDRMIDVHHTILPLTHRLRPNAAAMIARSVALESGLRTLAPADMIMHCVAHLFADGDLSGGLRNLWDFHQLLTEFCRDEDFWPTDGAPDALTDAVYESGLRQEFARAMRLSEEIFGTYNEPIYQIGFWNWRAEQADKLYLRRLLARNDWGKETRPYVRLGFYARSHWLRMPPLMLARHLWTKARR